MIIAFFLEFFFYGGLVNIPSSLYIRKHVFL